MKVGRLLLWRVDTGRFLEARWSAKSSPKIMTVSYFERSTLSKASEGQDPSFEHIFSCKVKYRSWNMLNNTPVHWQKS